MEGSAGGVRKGAWTHEEDDLLRKCIEKFGEEKWHQIPNRAGLNRCRKSCRLRWLNYLKPNIKRGEFTEDEVDMILRLHKLLGNRWSLIAGRLPGRTANDVKNYWNTHLRKKTHVSSSRKDWKTMNCSSTKNTQKINVIKPQPRTFSKKTLSVLHKKTDSLVHDTSIDIGLGKDQMYAASSSSALDTPDNEIMWWERLLQSSELVQETPASMGWSDGGTTTTTTNNINTANFWAEKSPQGGTDFDADLWNFLTTEEEETII